MTYLRIVGEILLYIVPIGQMAVLWLQISSYRRTGHQSLAVLVAGTALGVVCTGVSFVLSFMPRAGFLDQAYAIALTLAIVQVPIVVWGTAALLKSFEALHKPADGRLA